MDFNLNEAEQAAADLAGRILGDKVTTESLLELDAAVQNDDAEWFDRDAYAAIASAGLIGIAVPEAAGGGGLDLVAAGQILRAQGAHVAPMPLLNNMVAALTLDRFGETGAHDELLSRIEDGTGHVAIAIQEYLDDRLLEPQAAFDGTVLTGTKVVVEFADIADRVLVTASAADRSPILLLVDPAAEGVSMTPGRSTRLQPVWAIDFDAAPAELLTDDPLSVAWVHDRLIAGICATQLGVTETALAMTAGYTTEREQFGRPIATFQAVTQRLADQYINVEGIRLTAANALWRLANGQPADRDLRVAKYWASERATDVANATQHCHGGMGVSIDYPLHRYTLWNKHLTTSLGAGTQQLRELGRSFAR